MEVVKETLRLVVSSDLFWLFNATAVVTFGGNHQLLKEMDPWVLRIAMIGAGAVATVVVIRQLKETGGKVIVGNETVSATMELNHKNLLVEMDKRFLDLDRRFGEMESRFENKLALAVAPLTSQIYSLSTQLTARQTEVNLRFQHLEGRMTELSQKIDNVPGRVATLEKEMQALRSVSVVAFFNLDLLISKFTEDADLSSGLGRLAFTDSDIQAYLESIRRGTRRPNFGSSAR